MANFNIGKLVDAPRGTSISAFVYTCEQCAQSRLAYQAQGMSQSVADAEVQQSGWQLVVSEREQGQWRWRCYLCCVRADMRASYFTRRAETSAWLVEQQQSSAQSDTPAPALRTGADVRPPNKQRRKTPKRPLARVEHAEQLASSSTTPPTPLSAYKRYSVTYARVKAIDGINYTRDGGEVRARTQREAERRAQQRYGGQNYTIISVVELS